jgi:hypothetical protein
MGQLLHGSARTTAAVRRAIQPRQECMAKLANRSDLNPKTVATWQKRAHVRDGPKGPKQWHSTGLTLEEGALSVAVRRPTLRPLDDCLYAWQATLPHLTRSARHRCLQRHGISRLPAMAGEQPGKKQVKAYPLGYVHLDLAEVRTEEGTLHVLVAVARACKLADAESYANANNMVAAQFLRNLIAAIPSKIHTALTDHGTQCTNRKRAM